MFRLHNTNPHPRETITVCVRTNTIQLATAPSGLTDSVAVAVRFMSMHAVLLSYIYAAQCPTCETAENRWPQMQRTRPIQAHHSVSRTGCRRCRCRPFSFRPACAHSVQPMLRSPTEAHTFGFEASVFYGHRTDANSLICERGTIVYMGSCVFVCVFMFECVRLSAGNECVCVF